MAGVLFLCSQAAAQTLAAANGSDFIVNGMTSRGLSDTLRVCPLTDAEVDLFLECIEMLVIALPVDAQLAEDLTARELPLTSLSNSPVWAAVDGGIDCRDFICAFKKISIALPLLTEPDARPQGYPDSNLLVARNRLAEIDAALEEFNNAVNAAQEVE